MKPTLLILAAGIGSRYGGIKQLDQFGPNGETIIDYSLYDAIRSGFGKVVFIVRQEIKDNAEAIFAPKLKGKIDFDFAIQGIQSYVPEDLGTVERTKPWGTGHATLCAWSQTDTPFAVINADDFYGRDAFETMAQFLQTDTDDSQHAMIGYELKRTLSENGTVSRGICIERADHNLESVVERTKIFEENGKIYFEEEGLKTELAPETPVSMNFWGFKPTMFPLTKEFFETYARENINTPKAEFYIPTVMTKLIENGLGNCRVFRSSSDWFGVTYPDDKPNVQASLAALHESGEYPEKLW
ncbi:sugar phosphate nucleotidyltransferase [Dyadobacter sp. CY343]|uniref:nucleotidyltransferase family protein n=1 Tax=Dyadobacter sp. CY343 TaxID=2907299 RepID=UPI001F28E4FE|nr:sugar phosphate nucleotidyltransferase [Dyadobacter sp. CY343]MCE7061635.1 nucleotidyltransferase [Dyadobacter sp. CY343]